MRIVHVSRFTFYFLLVVLVDPEVNNCSETALGILRMPVGVAGIPAYRCRITCRRTAGCDRADRPLREEVDRAVRETFMVRTPTIVYKERLLRRSRDGSNLLAADHVRVGRIGWWNIADGHEQR